MTRPFNLLFWRRAVQLGMGVEAAQTSFFLFLDHQRMRLGISVLADARDLPRNLHIRFIRLNAKLMAGDFAAYNRLRELPDDGELIAEVRVEHFKPVGQVHS